MSSALPRFRRTHTIAVALPAERAMPLFSAKGERGWVPGWAPEFPAGEPAGAEDEGTVFVTGGHGAATFWVVAARTDRSIRYVRTTPGHSCGIVEVRERESADGRTTVDITYDLTALSPDGARELAQFAARYAEDIGGWERAIAAALSSA